jgi:hypothetical protein
VILNLNHLYKIIFILIFCFNSFALVYEDIPEGTNFKFLNQVDLIVNGNNAKGLVFYSKNQTREILNFYREKFKKEGYKEIQSEVFDNRYSIISFEKENLKISIQVLPQQKGDIILIYEIEEKTKSYSVEIKDIPKPFGLVSELSIERISGKEKCIMLFYKTKESKCSLENFYIKEMQKFGWKLLPNKEKEEDISLVFTKMNNWCLITITDEFISILYYYI